MMANGAGAMGANGQAPNPMALFTALMAAAQAMNLKQAFQAAKEGQQQGDGASSKQP